MNTSTKGQSLCLVPQWRSRHTEREDLIEKVHKAELISMYPDGTYVINLSFGTVSVTWDRWKGRPVFSGLPVSLRRKQRADLYDFVVDKHTNLVYEAFASFAESTNETRN